MNSKLPAYLQLDKQAGYDPVTLDSSLTGCLKIGPDGLPRLWVSGGCLSADGEIALGYLELGYWPIPLIQNSQGAWAPAIRWKAYQQRTPNRQEVVEWWMKYPHAGIALVCGYEAGLIILDVDPRHGGSDPKLSSPTCSTPRGGIHYHFVAPVPVPIHDAPGLEILGEGHVARVPPTPGYKWLGGGLPRRTGCYDPGQLPQTFKPRRPSSPATNIPQRGNLCDVLSQALGGDIRPGTNIKCFCHLDTEPSLAIYPDHGFCFSKWQWFSRRRVLEGLGLAHLFHIEGEKGIHEPNVQEGCVESNKSTGVESAREKERLARALKGLGFVDKAKEVWMCGKFVTKEKSGRVKTRTCENCRNTFVIQSRCHSHFCPECAAIEARDNLREKEAVFKESRCAIVRLPLPSLPETSSAAFSKVKKEVLVKLRGLLGRGCGPAYHKILTGCRNGEFRWELVVLAAETDIKSLEVGWPYGVAMVLKGLTPAQALAIYLEVTAKPPEWETSKDLVTLDVMLYRQRVKGSHGQAHGNSRAMKSKPTSAKTPQSCPVCGNSNLSRPVYRDAACVRWFDGIPLWFPPAPGRAPPGRGSDIERLRAL